jgi:hypothetical protein
MSRKVVAFLRCQRRNIVFNKFEKLIQRDGDCLKGDFLDGSGMGVCFPVLLLV